MVALRNIRENVFKSMRNAAGGGRDEQSENSGPPHGAAAFHRLASQAACRMRGSTLIETMIASVIFLCVFAISLETISRLTVKKNDNTILVEVDYRIKQCRREFTEEEFEFGTYLRQYQWGSIAINMKPYRNYEVLRELTIIAYVKNNAKRLEYKYIFETGDGV